MKKTMLVACVAALAVAGPAAAAKGKSGQAQAVPSPEASATTAAAGPEAKYCIKDSINSRILRSYCKSAQEWDRAGVPIEAKD